MIPTLNTPGVIADKLGVPIHRVQRILATRTNIVPSARAGTLRLYDRKAIEQIAAELQEQDELRSKRRSRDFAEAVA